MSLTRLRQRLVLLAALSLAAWCSGAAAKRCTPDGPAYDIEGRFKRITGWQLSNEFQMEELRAVPSDPCPPFARPGMDWCCQYAPDWGSQTSPTVARTYLHAAMNAGNGAACLSQTEVMMAACLAQEGCSAFVGTRLYLRPVTVRETYATWTDVPAPPFWKRCAPGAACPPAYVLADLGPRPYGRGNSCTRSFRVYATNENPDPTGVRKAYARFPNHYRRVAVLNGTGCAQFEGFVGGKLAFSVLDSVYAEPVKRFSWRSLEPCPSCRLARLPRGAAAGCSLCR